MKYWVWNFIFHFESFIVSMVIFYGLIESRSKIIIRKAEIIFPADNFYYG